MEYCETITPPSTLPVSTADLKAHLRLNDSSEDTLLSDWITAAASLFASTTGYSLTTTTLRLALDRWPRGGVVYLPRHPVASVTSTQYLDPAGSWQTLAGTTTDLGSVPSRVVLPTGLPALHATAVPRVRVQFVAGHSTAGAVPRLICVAIKELAAHWYASREAYGQARLSETPLGWRSICDQYRTGIVGPWNEVPNFYEVANA